MGHLIGSFCGCFSLFSSLFWAHHFKKESETDSERTSRSGRRIKPKRFADEEGTESVAPESLSPELPCSLPQVCLSQLQLALFSFLNASSPKFLMKNF